MLETLQTLSGSTHLSFRDNKSVTLDARRQFNQADSKVTLSTSVHEMPVISKSQMLNVPRSNMMIFGKGHPIWNRNQTVMPYAYALQKDELRDFENNIKYSLTTVPTTASTMDFDAIRNQPNFLRMVSKRVRQAQLAKEVTERYKQVYGSAEKPLTDYQMSLIPNDVLAKQIMQGINDEIYEEDHPKQNEVQRERANMSSQEMASLSASFDAVPDQPTKTDELEQKMQETAKKNTEVTEVEAERDAGREEELRKRYGGNTISRADLSAGDTIDNIATAYVNSIDAFRKYGEGQGFIIDDNGSLFYDGQVFVKSKANTIQDLINAKNTVVMPTSGQKGAADPSALVEITAAFISWIKKQDNLLNLVGGEFDREFKNAFARREDPDLSRDAV